jgi:small subunit ribosomal protein S20
MPITKSAKKALRGSFVKKAMNDRNKKLVKEAVKEIEKLVKEKAAKRGVIKKNNASNKKARLSKITKPAK